MRIAAARDNAKRSIIRNPIKRPCTASRLAAVVVLLMGAVSAFALAAPASAADLDSGPAASPYAGPYASPYEAPRYGPGDRPSYRDEPYGYDRPPYRPYRDDRYLPPHAANEPPPEERQRHYGDHPDDRYDERPYPPRAWSDAPSDGPRRWADPDDAYRGDWYRNDSYRGPYTEGPRPPASTAPSRRGWDAYPPEAPDDMIAEEDAPPRYWRAPRTW